MESKHGCLIGRLELFMNSCHTERQSGEIVATACHPGSLELPTPGQGIPGRGGAWEGQSFGKDGYNAIEFTLQRKHFLQENGSLLFGDL